MTAWLDPDELDRFQRSMQRCFADPSFMSRFYARFLLSNQEVATMFADIDIKKQASMLKGSLYLVMRAAHGFDDGLEHLAQISSTHGELGLNIGPHLYQYWLDTLVTVVAETDPAYEPSLEATWRAALQPCIDHMVGSAPAGRRS